MKLSAVAKWPIAKLSELVPPDDKINYGVVQPGDECPKGVPVIRVGDLEKGTIDRASLRCIAPVIEASYVRSRLRGDEVLLACVGSIGTVAIAEPKLVGCNIARAVARIRCGPRLDRRYLAHYLRSSACQRYFLSEARTVAQPTLNIRQIEALEIPVPPLPEQKRIAAILDKADAIRRKRQEAIRLTEELLRAAFLEMFGDPVTNPKGWEVRALGDIGTITDGTHKTPTYVDSGVPFLSAKNVRAHRIDWSRIKYIRLVTRICG